MCSLRRSARITREARSEGFGAEPKLPPGNDKGASLSVIVAKGAALGLSIAERPWAVGWTGTHRGRRRPYIRRSDPSAHPPIRSARPQHRG